MTPSLWNAQTAGPQRQEAEQWTHTEEPGAVLLIGAAGCLLSSPASPASLPSKRARPCAPLLDLCPSFQWFPPLSLLFISLLLLLPSAIAPPSTTNLGLQYGPFSSAHPLLPRLPLCSPLNGRFWIENLRSLLSTPASLSWNSSLSFLLLLAITLKQQARPTHSCSAGTWPRRSSQCHVLSQAGNSFWLPISIHRTAICSGCRHRIFMRIVTMVADQVSLKEAFQLMLPQFPY